MRRQAHELREERSHRSLHAHPGRQIKRRIAFATIDSEKLAEERDILLRIGRIRFDQCHELRETRLGAVLAIDAGGMLELADDREEGAVVMQRR